METFYAVGFTLIIVLGALGAAAAVFIFLSCRCFSAWKPSGKLMSNKKFLKFFKAHCNIWWVFAGLVSAHIIVAILYFFGPF